MKDLAVLKSALTALHPGVYRYNTPATVDIYFNEAAAEASQGITDKAFFLLVSKLTAKLKCGHTYLNPWNQKAETVRRYFSGSVLPVLYTIINRRLTVTHNLSENGTIKPGDEITGVNGISAAIIIDSLLTVSRTDGNNGRPRKMANLQLLPLDVDTTNYALFDIYFPLFFPQNFDTSHYRIGLKPFSGKPATVTVKAITRAERQKAYVTRFGDIPLHEAAWAFRYLRPGTGYLRLGDFETWEWEGDYKKYLDSVFVNLRSSGATHLIVDIRGNEGGDDGARTEVLSYLIRKSFGCEDPVRKRYRFLSVPDSLQPYLKSWNKEAKKPKNPSGYVQSADGYYEWIDTSATGCTPVAPKRNVFAGGVFLLTDAANSSTTATMAHLMQQTNTGTLIGQATGGTKQGLNGGQFFFLHLPHSKLEVDIPLIWGAPTKPQPDEGVQPDYTVHTTPQDVFLGRDAQLRFVLSLITAGKPPAKAQRSLNEKRGK